MAFASPVTSSGYSTPVRIVKATVTRIAMMSCFIFRLPLRQMQKPQQPVDQPDSRERRNHAAHAVDQQVAAQQRGGTHGLVLHAAQRQRNQHDNNQRVEYHGGQNGALWAVQTHDVELAHYRIHGHEHGRQNGKYLAMSLAM